MKDWDLLKAICFANNTRKTDELYKLIGETDFTDYPQASQAAILCITLTMDSVTEHKEALINYVKTANLEYMNGLREFVRFGLLQDLLGVERGED